MLFLLCLVFRLLLLLLGLYLLCFVVNAFCLRSSLLCFLFHVKVSFVFQFLSFFQYLFLRFVSNVICDYLPPLFRSWWELDNCFCKKCNFLFSPVSVSNISFSFLLLHSLLSLLNFPLCLFVVKHLIDYSFEHPNFVYFFTITHLLQCFFELLDFFQCI